MIAINAARLLTNLHALAEIGRTADDGVSRPALSEADLGGRDWFRAQAEAAGFEFRQDGAGNLSAILPSADPDAPTLLIGSHLDSVPNGGRYDGALGVLCALETLQTIAEAGIELPFHLEAISFTDEEGAFMGTLGSLAFSGRLTEKHFTQLRKPRAELEVGLQGLGLSTSTMIEAGREAARLAGFIEVHIEQGKRLEQAGLDIGVVTAIVGIRSYRLHFRGRAAHAGTTAMHERADAFLGAADFALRARDLVVERFSPGVVTCGQIGVEPGRFNIVPGAATLALEFRHSEQAAFLDMEAALVALAEEVAAEWGLKLTAEPLGRTLPAAMHPAMIEAVEAAADDLGLSHTRLISLAGHDARSLSAVTPTALVFTPSVDGISHNPHEFTRDADVINGANVLLHTVLRLAEDVS